MGLQVQPVTQRALSALTCESVLPSLLECKNYEVGILPGEDLVYVLGKNYNSVLSVTVIGTQPNTHKCRILEGGEFEVANEQLQQSRLIFFSGTCVRIGVQVEPEGSAIIYIEQIGQAPQAVLKVKK